MSENWLGRAFEIDLGKPGHGGFVVGRYEGRVVFVRHGLPGERVLARVTEDRGGSFCRADAVEIVNGSSDRVEPSCPISGPGGSGCCDYSHAALPAQRAMKSAVVEELLDRIAGVEQPVSVEELPGTAGGSGWRTRVRLAVGSEGRPGFHRYRSAELVTELACPQMASWAYRGVAEIRCRPGAEIQVTIDSNGERHLVELAPPRDSKTGRSRPGRRGATARRAARGARRSEHVLAGSGRAVERVGEQSWTLSATGFWQAHRSAASTYSALVSEWAQLSEGSVAWDLYGGVGVFASVLADQVGPDGKVESVEFAGAAVAAGRAALGGRPQIVMHEGRVERLVASMAERPQVVVLDPPRAGAGRPVVAAVAAAAPEKVVHVGCDPAAFARDLGLYRNSGYRVEALRAFDAFPLTHHVECVALLTR
ncbi:class I SAM-dependent RNA methyltransferase [Rhodococcus sp. NPDC058521]|uniref:class I SAM-dependent RNA methyltransferase n=1 Tax=Rhodococcus sp. NPDC058521 TaxID=3346536 RepID=UPI003654057E